MWKINSFIFFLGAAISFKQAFAVTDEERAEFSDTIMPIAKECAEELGADVATIAELKTTQSVDPCFIACMLEKQDILKDGEIDADAAITHIKSFIHDESEVETLADITEDCATQANDLEVDGDYKDCERAHMFLHCLKEKKAMFGMKP